MFYTTFLHKIIYSFHIPYTYTFTLLYQRFKSRRENVEELGALYVFMFTSVECTGITKIFCVPYIQLYSVPMYFTSIIGIV